VSSGYFPHTLRLRDHGAGKRIDEAGQGFRIEHRDARSLWAHDCGIGWRGDRGRGGCHRGLPEKHSAGRQAFHLHCGTANRGSLHLRFIGKSVRLSGRMYVGGATRVFQPAARVGCSGPPAAPCAAHSAIGHFLALNQEFKGWSRSTYEQFSEDPALDDSRAPDFNSKSHVQREHQSRDWSRRCNHRFLFEQVVKIGCIRTGSSPQQRLYSENLLNCFKGGAMRVVNRIVITIFPLAFGKR
jgi:hypothetical protein